MKQIIMQIESIMKYPPTLSLLRVLVDRGDDVYLLSSENDHDVRIFCKENDIKLIDLGIKYRTNDSAIKKFVNIPLLNKRLNDELNIIYDNDSFIWVMTSITLKYVGNSLYGKKYIMYMYELSQEIRYYPALAKPRINLVKLFNNSTAVIECEYNRAHIAKAWFGLEKVPYIVPNKPYVKTMERHMEITDETARLLIERIKDKFIIIYQGIIDAERPLEPFIDAVSSMGEKYALVIMSGNIDKIKDYAQTKKNTYLLPFVKPPHHLEITSWAQIGILTYVPVRGATTSPLNAVYCAPNKIYEYAMFGIPMIGNNIPGLRSILHGNEVGRCFDEFDSGSIEGELKQIIDKYEYYSKKSKAYYKETENVLQRVVQDIVDARR